ncbi:ammonium transporter [Phenylobacterium sp.]|jgi:Amt family ammonium transporter|uniref:ammonium transporter n=1 Tax=Phenylobacterium sp. TaxID=1871053 RepID=UPI002E373502|nr:ammonium transporter [Phenylobacterium sp.]HEX4709315.1 ammonium transporter [Phenylobacterium sp.]
MKLIGLKRLAGLALAAAVIGAPFAGSALAQNTTAPAAPAAAAPATPAAPEAAAAAPAAAAPAAAAPTPPKIDTGDTAWMLTSSVLVLMMTIPGLALFYAGMVRKKNILATLAQSFAATALITVLWMVIGYSIAFTDGGNNNAFIGGVKYLLLGPMGLNATSTLAPTIPESVYMFFQMTFAIITPALIAGALADRMKFSAFLAFMGAWLLLVYCPIAHWVWGNGWLGKAGALDFAGGTVVHLNAGTAGLVAALMLGKRKGLGTENMAPHNLAYSVIGASLLWVGWFGFNAGSAVTSNVQAGMAAVATQIATAGAALAWMFAEWIIAKKPSVLGMVSGAVAGLVAITPASGFVNPMDALLIGIAAGVVCYISAVHVKKMIGYDDALDAWGVHGVGGALGALLTGVFASSAINSASKGWIHDHNPGQMILQLEDIGATFAYCAVMTFVILLVIKYTLGLRVSEEAEVEGLDINLHGEVVQA